VFAAEDLAPHRRPLIGPPLAGERNTPSRRAGILLSHRAGILLCRPADIPPSRHGQHPARPAYCRPAPASIPPGLPFLGGLPGAAAATLVLGASTGFGNIIMITLVQ
jgi:hypothetical protein